MSSPFGSQPKACIFDPSRPPPFIGPKGGNQPQMFGGAPFWPPDIVPHPHIPHIPSAPPPLIPGLPPNIA